MYTFEINIKRRESHGTKYRKAGATTPGETLWKNEDYGGNGFGFRMGEGGYGPGENDHIGAKLPLGAQNEGKGGEEKWLGKTPFPFGPISQIQQKECLFFQENDRPLLSLANKRTRQRREEKKTSEWCTPPELLYRLDLFLKATNGQGGICKSEPS